MKNKLTAKMDQAKQIIEAATNRLQGNIPVNEDWYQKRLSICSTCEYNSDNISEDKKGFVQKLRENYVKCPQTRYCTACGCCIDDKAGIKRAICGLKEIGLEPKWGAEEAESPLHKDIHLESSGEYKYLIQTDADGFTIDLGESSSPLISYEFKLFVPMQYQYVSSEVGCGCTVVKEVINVSVSEKIFKIDLSTKSFQQGVKSTRNLWLKYGPLRILVKQKITRL